MLTLETAKQLKEAGWNKPCSNVWVIYINGGPELIKATPFLQTKIRETEYYFPCPTTDELLAELPEWIDKDNDIYWLCLEKFAGQYWATYRNPAKPNDPLFEATNNKEPAECLTHRWLKLKKEGLIK